VAIRIFFTNAHLVEGVVLLPWFINNMAFYVHDIKKPMETWFCGLGELQLGFRKLHIIFLGFNPFSMDS
jgi:hypothetical protein